MADETEHPTPQGDGTEAFVGLSESAAQDLAKSRGWNTVRVIEPDAMITMEYLEGRINLAVADGVVVRCWKG
ncbi:I78 family peptidase inhibitor [Streptomyces sp. 549]|uniref:I78 family peptidase inhibitor n=1 Tax=Streptomyces sp. 549 TaxID=3049076 RepID=UPI0024C29AFA|nr:I78 family peptidase inhibitor [Streptomyces sp. 549]MDK1475658.1 I78 family peptidase inhibitor [Streptomyces sp. 549]